MTECIHSIQEERMPNDKRVFDRRKKDKIFKEQGVFCVQHTQTSEALKELVILGTAREQDTKWVMRQFRWFLAASGTILLFLAASYITISYQHKLEMQGRNNTRAVIVQSIADMSKVIATQDIRLTTIEKLQAELALFNNTIAAREAVRAFQSSRIDLLEKNVLALSDLVHTLHKNKVTHE